MNEERLPRKLAAIFYADVAGYSRLTGEDEDATHRRLSEFLDLISSTIVSHHGQVMHYAGDAVLARFDAVLDAVSSATQIQIELKSRNSELPGNKKVEFRIGINLGDVIEDRGDIYGDGVNVAARLEGLATPGGICVSDAVRSALGNKLDLEYESMGEQRVKNIARSVHAYHIHEGGLIRPGNDSGSFGVFATRRRSAILTVLALVSIAVLAGVYTWRGLLAPGTGPASAERVAPPLAEKPSIAVLPFDNLSGDKSQDYLADGMTEDIITNISQIDQLLVIARNSTFVYKNRAVKIQDVAEDLGVRYVLEGSVQKVGSRLRITAQLIDAETGHHLWSERFDRDESDLFLLQDEIADRIATALQVELIDGEQMQVWRDHSPNLDAWRELGKGNALFYRFTRVANAQARQAFSRAIEIDSEYALAYGMLAWTHWMDADQAWEDRASSFKRAKMVSQTALALDQGLPIVHGLVGAIFLSEGEHEKALASAQRAVRLNPNHATSRAILGMIQRNIGQAEKAIPTLKLAMRLSPYHADWFKMELAAAYDQSGQSDKALLTLEEYLARSPDSTQAAKAYTHIAILLNERGSTDEARIAVARAIESDPGISISEMAKQQYHTADGSRLEKLRELGLPE